MDETKEMIVQSRVNYDFGGGIRLQLNMLYKARETVCITSHNHDYCDVLLEDKHDGQMVWINGVYRKRFNFLRPEDR